MKEWLKKLICLAGRSTCRPRGRIHDDSRSPSRRLLRFGLVVLGCALTLPVLAYEAEGSRDYTTLSLEALMDIEVTSVSKKAEQRSDAPAAIYVITQEDMRRSGVTSIPEALRMVPGLQVAKLDANKWAISSRGFNGRFANKLLVLMDGRSVYTPLFSGVFWDVQDTLLEDIDRIEVIRGPGATLWGANAVNGVINIITKNAAETQGGLITVGAGTEEKAFGSVRYGDALGEHAHYRVFLKYFDRDQASFASGDDAADEWDSVRGGFRLDWNNAGNDTFMLQGEVYDNNYGETITGPLFMPPYSTTFNDDDRTSGGHLLGRWEKALDEGNQTALQLYYDRTERESSAVDQSRDTIDVDFQHDIQLGDTHYVIWGAGYRYTEDHLHGKFVTDYDPEQRQDHLFSAFMQDEITLIEDLLKLTLGTKFEDNDYTGVEVQPSARVSWTPTEKSTWWAAVARAVRTPSRAEESVSIASAVIPPGGAGPGSPLSAVTLLGDEDYASEELVAYELGYRVTPTEALSVDIAAFFNDYENLRTLEPGIPFPDMAPVPHMVIPFSAGNEMAGHTYGVEVAADLQVREWWQVRSSYSYLEMDLDPSAFSLDSTAKSPEGESPHNQVYVRSLMNLPMNTEFDAMFRYVDNLGSLGIPGYTSVDLRFGWRPSEDIDVSLVGQNLLDDQHEEFGALLLDTAPTEQERSVYAKVTVSF